MWKKLTLLNLAVFALGEPNEPTDLVKPTLMKFYTSVSYFIKNLLKSISIRGSICIHLNMVWIRCLFHLGTVGDGTRLFRIESVCLPGQPGPHQHRNWKVDLALAFGFGSGAGGRAGGRTVAGWALVAEQNRQFRVERSISIQISGFFKRGEWCKNI